MGRFEIRAATAEHLGGIQELAKYLDTVNLPDDAQAVAQLVDTSEKSFSRRIEDVARREYVFVLLDGDTVIGTSMVFGQLGRRDAPYIYFDVRMKEKYSATLDRHLVHTILATTYSYDGPTEIGGLVVRPEYRKHPQKLGLLISAVRFLFIAMRRADMRDQVLAELLPPLSPDGTSHLWEAVGARYTGLSYHEADRLSRRNKEFIKELFPAEIPVTLLPEAAQRVIGQVGEQTRGVQRLLERIGFRYANRVDPFDGGPHFLAETDRIRLVRDARHLRVKPGAPETPEPLVAAIEYEEFPYIRAVSGTGQMEPDGVLVDQATLTGLEAGSDDRLWVLPV